MSLLNRDTQIDQMDRVLYAYIIDDPDHHDFQAFNCSVMERGINEVLQTTDKMSGIWKKYKSVRENARVYADRMRYQELYEENLRHKLKVEEVSPCGSTSTT